MNCACIPVLWPLHFLDRKLIIHNLQLKLASFSWSGAKVKQPLWYIIKVYYKVIEILAMRWLRMKLLQIFKETTKAMKASWMSPGNNDKVSIICFPYKLNIVLEGW